MRSLNPHFMSFSVDFKSSANTPSYQHRAGVEGIWDHHLIYFLFRHAAFTNISFCLDGIGNKHETGVQEFNNIDWEMTKNYCFVLC